jgi:hypothetical protein
VAEQAAALEPDGVEHVRIGDGAVEVWSSVAELLAGPEPGSQNRPVARRLKDFSPFA